MVVALLYEMQSPCNCFTLSLSGSDSRRRNSWRDDNDASMEIKLSSRWRWWSWRCFGDGDQRHKMMMAISYHLFDCMWCLSFMHLILLSTMVELWDAPSLKFQGISVLHEYAPLLQFVMPRHHVMIGCDKLYVHIQWVQASFAHAEYSG